MDMLYYYVNEFKRVKNIEVNFGSEHSFTYEINQKTLIVKDYVREIIKGSIIYNDIKIDELLNQYQDLFKSRDEIVNLLISNYISDDLSK